MALYTFATAKTEIQFRLGNRTDLGTRLDAWLNSACLTYAKADIELPMLEEIVTRNTPAGQNEYGLQTAANNGFNIPDLLGIRWIRNQTTNLLMRYISWRTYRSLSTQASGSPTRWSRKGYLLALDPIPSNAVADVLKLDYRKRPTAGSLAQFDDEHHEWLIGLATYYGWLSLQEFDKANSVKSALPAYLRIVLELPMGQDEFEARGGERARMVFDNGYYDE